MYDHGTRAPVIHRGGAPSIEALAAGLIHRAGLDPLAAYRRASQTAKNKQELYAERGYAYRDLSLSDYVRETLRAVGRTPTDNRLDNLRAAASTGQLANVFTGVVGAQLISSYEETLDTTSRWTRTADVTDFKTQERVRMGKAGSLEQLPRGDTAKHATRGDSKEEYKVVRYAKQFAIDEQDIIDDNLNALLDMPDEMGRAAGRLRPDLVYAILLANDALGADSVVLFHAATHGNLDTGAGLAKDTLEAAIAAMSTQSEDGVPLNLFAKTLLVPHGLRITAKELIRSQTLVVAGSTNVVRGDFNALSDEDLVVVSDSRLDNGVTDPATGTVHSGSATTWFMAALEGRHTIEVGYLQGTNRQPTIRGYTLDRGQYGVGWDVKLDIGAKALDYRGLHKSTT